MTRLETGLLDLAESLLRNDDIVHDADYQTLYSIATDVSEVESENAKLRELVRASWKCVHTGASCSDCRLIAGGCTLQSAMRELGIEV